MPRVVCIVEPDELVRAGLARLVETGGYSPQPCHNVQALIRDAGALRPACAVLDLSDAGLRVPALRDAVAELAGVVPVIALSARDDAATQSLAKVLGARAFFRKPVDAAALLDSIGWFDRMYRP